MCLTPYPIISGEPIDDLIVAFRPYSRKVRKRLSPTPNQSLIMMLKTELGAFIP